MLRFTLAHLYRHPAPRPVGQGHARGNDPSVHLGPGALWAIRVDTTPAVGVPREARGTTEGGKVDQSDDRPILHLSGCVTVRALRPVPVGRYVYLHRLIQDIVDPEHRNLGQSHQ